MRLISVIKFASQSDEMRYAQAVKSENYTQLKRQRDNGATKSGWNRLVDNLFSYSIDGVDCIIDEVKRRMMLIMMMIFYQESWIVHETPTGERVIDAHTTSNYDHRQRLRQACESRMKDGENENE